MVCSLKQRSGCNKTNNKSGKSENIEKKDLDILNEKTIYLKSKSKEFEKNLDLSNIVDINENNVEIMVNTSNYHHNFLKNFLALFEIVRLSNRPVFRCSVPMPKRRETEHIF